MKKIFLNGWNLVDSFEWIHRGYSVTLNPEPCVISSDGVTTNRYEVWGPDADQSFIAPAHTLLEAKAAIDADLMR